MPDVYVPYISDTNLIYINQLSSRGLVLRYSFNYSNGNRKTLLKTYPNVAIFKEKFEVSQTLLDELIAYGESHGLEPNRNSIKLYNERLRTLLKAYIARDLFGDSGYYPIALPFDEDFKKALEVLRK